MADKPFGGSPQEWQDFVSGLNEPLLPVGDYGPSEYHPAPRMAPTPEPTPIPAGTRVVTIKRDSMGAIVEKTTREGPAQDSFGGLMAAGALLLVGCLVLAVVLKQIAHRFG